MSYSKSFGTQGKASKGSVFIQMFCPAAKPGLLLAITPSKENYKKQFSSEAAMQRFYATARRPMMINLDAGWEVAK